MVQTTQIQNINNANTNLNNPRAMAGKRILVIEENNDMGENFYPKNPTSATTNYNENKCFINALQLLAERATWNIMEGDTSVTVKMFK